MSNSHYWPATCELDALIDSARGGSPSALGKLLESAQDYLLLVASRELGPDLRSKVGASDLVQETFIKAQQGFAMFRGTTAPELLGWLRQILLNQTLGTRRRYSGTNKRNIARELSSNGDFLLQQILESIPGPELAPTAKLAIQEDLAAIYAAIEKLSPLYRDVIVLRYWENLSFEQIGQRIGKTPDAARKLWMRAVDHLELCGFKP